MIREFRGSLSGREVFAIPGSIHNPQERGCNALIRNGAKLVETGGNWWKLVETKEDILEELPVDTSQPIQAIYT
jgi:DNA processing protein